MPALAVARWAEFEGDFGPLTLHERLDHLFGWLAYHIWNAAHGERAPDFQVKWRQKKPLTDEDIWRWLGAMSSAPKVRPE